MHLTMVTGAFPMRSQLFLVNKARSLAERGHRVTVVATEPGDGDLDAEIPETVRHRVTVTYQRRHGGMRAYLETATGALRAAAADVATTRRLFGLIWDRHEAPRRRWARLVRSLPLVGLKTDLVHVEWSSKAAERSEVLCLLRVPKVVSCRGSDVAIMPLVQPELGPELRWLFGRVDAVHCSSEAVRGQAVALGAPRERTFVNHPAVDPGRFLPSAQRQPPSGPWRLLSVGRVHWVKGHDDGIRAVRLLLDRGCDIRYTIVGGGSAEEMAALRLTIGDLGLDGVVSLTGPLASADVRHQLGRADVYLSSSVSEGMSNATLEAMATGLPVVVTSVGGMAELVRPGVDGLVVPARDPHAMADAIEGLVLDPPRRQQLGRRARQRVLSAFTLEQQADVFCREYQRLLSGQPIAARP